MGGVDEMDIDRLSWIESPGCTFERALAVVAATDLEEELLDLEVASVGQVIRTSPVG